MSKEPLRIREGWITVDVESADKGERYATIYKRCPHKAGIVMAIRRILAHQLVDDGKGETEAEKGREVRPT